MAQRNINFGSFPDDPNSDAIRDAFQKIQENFSELFSDTQNRGVRSINRTPGTGRGITRNFPTGDVIISANIPQVTVTSTTLSLSVFNGNSTTPAGSLATITNGDTDQIVINIPQTLENISNIAVANTITTNNLVVNVSITGSNASLTGNLSAAGITSTSANITNLTANTANVSGTATIGNIQANVGNVGSLGATTITAGNVTATRFIGDGSQLSNVVSAPGPLLVNGTSRVEIPTTNGNIIANVNGNNIATISAAGMSVVGNITATRFNGTLANGGTSNINITGGTGNINLAVAGNNRIIATASGANVVGELGVSGNAELQVVSANTITTIGNISGPRLISTTTNAAPFVVSSNIQVANLNASLLQGRAVAVNSATPETVVARNSDGNIIVNGISGNGASLTNILGLNVVGSVEEADVAGTVSVGSQPNITALGTLTGLTSTGTVNFGNARTNLGPVGNITILGGTNGQVLSTDGAGNLSWTSAASASTAITVTANAQPNITSVGTLTSLSVSGNISAGNVSASTVTATNLAGTLTTASQPNITQIGSLANLQVTGNANLVSAIVEVGDISTLRILGGQLNQVIRTNGMGNLFWTTTGKAENVIYVSKSGNDSNTGESLDNAKLTIKAAAEAATPGTVVFVKAGDYTENNPISISARVSIIGDNLRSVTVRPANPSLDILHVRNGDYVFGMTFRDHVSPAAAVAFPPITDPKGPAGNIFTSPYIQSCSSITTTGAGMRVDGSLAGGLKSMVTDSFTQFNQGGIGVHILNEGYAQLVSIFTINCSEGVLCESGGQCSVANSNNSFGDFGLVADGQSAPKYSGTVDSFVNGTVVVNDLSQRPVVNDTFQFSGDTTWYTVRTATPLNDGQSIVAYNQPAGASPTTGTVVTFYQPSLINASGQTFEYVGAGTDLLTSTPRLGGIPIQENEVVALNGGIVNWTSTDHFGDFRIGSGLVIEKEAGTISGETFERGLFAVLTPYILALEGGN